MKHILAKVLIVGTLALSAVSPSYAGTRYTDLADCASRSRSTTCYAGETLVRVKAQGKKDKVQPGRIIRQEGKYYILDTGKRTIKITIEVIP